MVVVVVVVILEVELELELVVELVVELDFLLCTNDCLRIGVSTDDPLVSLRTFLISC